MITLKTLFLPPFYLSTNTSAFTTLHHPHNTTRRSSVFPCLCSTNSNVGPDNNSKPEGDVESQKLLALMDMLLTPKVRRTTQFGEEAKADGEDALKIFDEINKRITQKVAKAKERKKRKDETREKIEGKTTKNVVLLFVGLVVCGTIGSMDGTDLNKFLVLGPFVAALFTQFIIEGGN